MDEVWKAFEESKTKKHKYAWVADREESLVLCATGRNEVECFEAMTELLAKFEHCIILALDIDYDDELNVGMTAIVSEVVYPNG